MTRLLSPHMDFITQNILGAVAGQATLAKRLGWKAVALGAIGGALPDFDTFLTPLADPAFPHEYHRHFTHSLIFIPVGAAIATLPFLIIPSVRRDWRFCFLAALLGCASHALLDCCTSYGTMWYWPFSHERVSWDLVSIIDFAVTLPLLLGLIIAAKKRARTPAFLALLWSIFYIGVLGTLQRNRALDAQKILAASRGHDIQRGRAFPTLGNLFLWRSVYESDGFLHADAIALNGPAQFDGSIGESIPLLIQQSLPPQVQDSQRIMEVFAKFSAFADGYLAVTPPQTNLNEGRFFVGDMRYSRKTHGFEALWGITINPHDAIAPVRWSGWRTSTSQAIDLSPNVQPAGLTVGKTPAIQNR